jgi:type IV pilus assembly protein PilN
MIRINLLKPERKEVGEAPAAAAPREIKERGNQSLFGLIPLAAVIAVAALFFFQRSAIKKEQNLLEQARQEKQSLQYVVAKLEELESQREILQRKIDLIVRLQAEQPSAVIIMDELSQKLPDWVWLTDATFRNGLVNLKGRAITNTLLSDYIENLEGSPYLSGVQLISSIQRRVRNDSYYEFTLAANFVSPALAQSAPNPAKEGEGQ